MRLDQFLFNKVGARSYCRKFREVKLGGTSLWSRRFVPGLFFGLAAGLGFGLYKSFTRNSWKIQANASSKLDNLVNLQPPTDVAPFPPTISINKELFQAIGTGVRTVTFLNFHVYAAGLYISVDDIHLARHIINELGAKINPTNDKSQWLKILNDPETGSQVCNELLSKNIRFAVRIVPTRNTDFNHLRDGFVRSVTNHKEFKAIQSAEVGSSISEIKKAFSRKRKLRKGEVVTWSRDLSGGMSAWLGDSDEGKELLGSPENLDVARLFFLQYLSGSKPNSPTLKIASLEGLVRILM